MGVKGIRKKTTATDVYSEPVLLINVNSILNMAQENGLYIENVLQIEKVIATINDIEIRYEELDPSVSGYLSFNGNKWIMCINKNHNRKRQRFTMAHELGHYFLHKNKNPQFVDTTYFRGISKDSIEYSANEFASQLLMPEDKVRKLVEQDKIKNIGELALQFDVSAAAMKYRVLQLGYKIKDNG